MSDKLTFLRATVRHILLTTPVHEFTAQGFGFLRTYFGPPDKPKQFRLNLWDHRFTVPNVSTIHDHPWDFSSVIVAGHFSNQRYMVAFEPGAKLTHDFTTLKTGVGGGLLREKTRSCILIPHTPEVYYPGMTYAQKADEVHETLFEDGSVTLNERVGDTEHARVFWPHGTDWIDAMPRQATRDEVAYAVQHSLERWFR